MSKNVKTIIVNVPDEVRLDLINKTFALRTLFREQLSVGDNELRVNHFNYSAIKRMSGNGFTLIEK